MDWDSQNRPRRPTPSPNQDNMFPLNRDAMLQVPAERPPDVRETVVMQALTDERVGALDEIHRRAKMPDKQKEPMSRAQKTVAWITLGPFGIVALVAIYVVCVKAIVWLLGRV